MKTQLHNIILALAFTSFGSSLAQDPGFRMYHAADMLTNPAFTGSTSPDKGPGARVSLQSRTQWTGLAGKSLGYLLAYDEHVGQANSGFGLMVTRADLLPGGDYKSNVLSANAINGLYSYGVFNQKLSMRFGFQASLNMNSLSPGKIDWPDQADPVSGFVLPSNETVTTNTKTFVNAAAGALFYNNDFYLSLAAHNVLKPNIAFLGATEKLDMKYSVMAGYNIKASEDIIITPSVYAWNRGDFSQINGGLYAQGKVISGGLNVYNTFGLKRKAMGTTAYFGIQGQKVRLGYAVDLSMGFNNVNTPVSHELSLCFLLRRPYGEKPYFKPKMPHI